MKAVIVDLVNGQAAALCDDGRVVKLADPGYSLGQIVELHERKRRTPLWLRYASTAAAAALLLVGAGGGAAYAMPYGVVSLDVNPSLEYTINRFDYVLKVEGVNEDGKELLSRMDTSQLRHRRIGEALEASVRQLEDGDWLGGESDEILISAGTKRPAHAERLISSLQAELGSTREELEIHALTVSVQEIDAAHREGMSAGRHRMLDQLRESEGEDFVPGDWKDRPIRDLFSRLENGPEGTAEQSDARSARPEPRVEEHADAGPEEPRSGSADAQPRQQDVPQQSAEQIQPNRPGQDAEQPQSVPGGNRHDGGAEPFRPDSGGFGGASGPVPGGFGGEPGRG